LGWFALEAREAVGTAGHCGGEDFEGYITPQLGIGCTVDLAHATGADGGGDSVMGERAANQIGAPGKEWDIFLGMNPAPILQCRGGGSWNRCGGGR